MTRFNIRYLYISLVGLLFEAIGACGYCLSNIQTNTSARRKTTINSNDFIHLSANNNSGNSLLYNQTHRTSIPSSDQPNVQQRQPPSGGTIILSNGTLTGRTSMDGAVLSNQNANNDESGSATIVIEDASAGPNLSNPRTDQATDVTQSAENRDNVDSSNIPSSNENSITILASNNPNQVSSVTQFNELPKNQVFQAGSAGETSDFSSATSLLGNHRAQEEEESEAQNENRHQLIAADGEPVLTQVNISQISDKASSSSSSASNSGNHQIIDIAKIQAAAPQRTCIADGRPTNRDHNHQTKPLQNSDLNSSPPHSHTSNLIPSDASDSAAVRKTAARQRQANLRRTLVMGLGGEEEMIEIDEDDLDNMSILPPPYESIAGDSSAAAAAAVATNQQQFTDI